jgi:hypothetical protein
MNKFKSLFVKTNLQFRQVVELETCFNPSILWLPTIIYYKKLKIYIFNLTQFDFFSLKKILCWCCCPFKLAKIGHKNELIKLSI